MTALKFKKILRQIHDGDMQALSSIYNEYYEKMVISAKFILKNRQDAEDAASNVILKILNLAIGDGNVHIENVGAYINVAIKNESISIYNRRKNLICDSAIPEQGEPCSELGRTLDRVLIEQILSKLSDSDREIAMLFYFYDYKTKEIADCLKLPEGTVKWKLHDIRKQFHKILK